MNRMVDLGTAVPAYPKATIRLLLHLTANSEEDPPFSEVKGEKTHVKAPPHDSENHAHYQRLQ
jgi:hypothetical protein